MDNSALDGAIGVVGVASIAGLLLPSIDEAWKAPPGDGETKHQIRAGEKVYFLTLLAVGTLQSMRHRSLFPLAFALALGATIAYTYEHALHASR